MNRFETMKEFTDYCLALMKKLEPKGDFDLVVVMDGAIVVQKLLIKGLLRKGVIIDVLQDDRLLKNKVLQINLKLYSLS